MITAADKLERHRLEALAFQEHAAYLQDEIRTLPVNSERYRRLNQQVGYALKLASVNANLALAVATAESAARIPEQIA